MISLQIFALLAIRIYSIPTASGGKTGRLAGVIMLG